MSLWRYFVGVYGRCLPAAAAVTLGAYAIERYARPANPSSFVLWVAALVVLYLSVVHTMVLDDGERLWRSSSAVARRRRADLARSLPGGFAVSLRESSDQKRLRWRRQDDFSLPRGCLRGITPDS